MKLYRNKNSFAFCTFNTAIGKNLHTGKYFVRFIYPFFSQFTHLAYRSYRKPKMPLFIISILLLPFTLLLIVLASLYLIGYVLFTIIGVFNLIDGIRDSRKLGGFINLVSIFCVVLFYLIGVISLIKILSW